MRMGDAANSLSDLARQLERDRETSVVARVSLDLDSVVFYIWNANCKYAYNNHAPPTPARIADARPRSRAPDDPRLGVRLFRFLARVPVFSSSRKKVFPLAPQPSRLHLVRRYPAREPRVASLTRSAFVARSWMLLMESTSRREGALGGVRDMRAI